MKKLIILVLVTMFASLLSLGSRPAQAATPGISVSWSSPSMAGWAFGQCQKSLNIHLDNPDLYQNIFRTDVIWVYGSGASDQMHASWMSYNADNSYTATFDLDSSTYGKAGYIEIIVNDSETGQPITGPQTGIANMSLYMAHNINLKGMAGSAYASSRADLTTDLSTITDFRAVNLDIMLPSVGNIHYIQPLDLTSPAAMQSLALVYSKMDAAKGRLGLSGSLIPALTQTGADVTLYDLPYTSMPELKYNGGSAGGSALNIAYNPASKVATFRVSHFSTYTVVPVVTLINPADGLINAEEGRYTIEGKVNDPAAVVKIYVGSTDQGPVTINPDGSFTKDIVLSGSANSVRVTSSNSIGSGSDIILKATNVEAASLARTGLPSVYLEILAGLFLVGLALAIAHKKIA